MQMTEIYTEIDPVTYTLVEAAEAAGWTVIKHEDSRVLATRTVVGDRHAVRITPGGEHLADPDPQATRLINDKQTDKTNQPPTILNWLVGSALRDAEHRGSKGEFTYLTA
jgi:hypothetical protein